MVSPKLLVIGLDCASPELVFEEFREDLPNLSKMVENGLYGTLKTCMPPITIPAWMVMFTGKKPGKLGIYGFRHRKDNSYSDIWITSPRDIKEPKIWDILGNRGKKSCLFAIPPSYPPPYVNGWVVSCFLTPGSVSNYTYPSELKTEIEDQVNSYIPDIEIRTGNLTEIRDQTFQMLENNMKIIKYLLKEKPWDFFAFVEIGVDRIQHAFWRYHDKEHQLYKPDSKFKDVIREYYKAIDQHIGEILKKLDNTYVLVVSDHGVKPMQGAFCINEWLIREDYLVLKNPPKKPTKISEADIDWSKTKAWGWGGYYSRIFLNVKGREKNGIIDKKDYREELEILQQKLRNLKDHNGQPMNNLVFNPEEVYSNPKGDYPDLMIIYDNLNWRAAGTIGHDSCYIFENETASGDAMHDWDGLFILYDPNNKLPRGKTSANIEDITPTILHLLGEKIPKNLDGKVIQNVK